MLIDRAEDLQKLLDAISHEPFVTVDTEFLRETTYYPHLGLIQVASQTQLACIDPLAFDAETLLHRLFEAPNTIKVFHSCSQDLEVLYHQYHVLPTPLHDTQIAIALLTPDEQIGYARLIEQELGIKLAKTQTRTNWLKRPLSKAQLQYAGDDVSYLYQCYQKLLDKLTAAGRIEWFEWDCQRILEHSAPSSLPFQIDFSTLWRRVKGHQKFSGIQLARIQAIAVWREQLAMQVDRTRRRILADDTVIELAQSTGKQHGVLKQKLQRSSRLGDEQIDSLLLALQTADELPPENWPEHTFSIPDVNEKKRLKVLQNIIADKARALNISPGTLCSRKALEQLVQGKRELKVLQDWRLELVGKQLLEHL